MQVNAVATAAVASLAYALLMGVCFFFIDKLVGEEDPSVVMAVFFGLFMAVFHTYMDWRRQGRS